MQTVTGTVSSIDTARRLIVVHWTTPVLGEDDEITLQVPEDADLTRGKEKMFFSQLMYGDRVTVKYYSEPGSFAGLKVISIIAS
jgi:hypothetical protein